MQRITCLAIVCEWLVKREWLSLENREETAKGQEAVESQVLKGRDTQKRDNQYYRNPMITNAGQKY